MSNLDRQIEHARIVLEQACRSWANYEAGARDVAFDASLRLKKLLDKRDALLRHDPRQPPLPRTK